MISNEHLDDMNTYYYSYAPRFKSDVLMFALNMRLRRFHGLK